MKIAILALLVACTFAADEITTCTETGKQISGKAKASDTTIKECLSKCECTGDYKKSIGLKDCVTSALNIVSTCAGIYIYIYIYTSEVGYTDDEISALEKVMEGQETLKGCKFEISNDIYIYIYKCMKFQHIYV